MPTASCDSSRFDVVVLVGPSHFVGFDGVAAFRGTGFETPLGVAPIDRDCTESLMQASAIVRDYPAAHAREHSLEMQLPFLLRVAPQVEDRGARHRVADAGHGARAGRRARRRSEGP